MVIIIEGDSDPSIKTEALQPVEEITISPATLEQINLEVTKDKSSDCGTVASPHREKEPNWGTSPKTEGSLIWGSPKGDAGSNGKGHGGWGSSSSKGSDSKRAEGSPFNKPTTSRLYGDTILMRY